MRVTLNFPLQAALLPALVALAMAGTPVQAAPRDQVLSKAFGCAGIGEARLWLDCYYGAAQPMRAALGLQPAPAAQVALALSSQTSGAPQTGQSPQARDAPQAAPIRQSVLSEAARCGPPNDNRKWLDCYYAAAQPMRAYLNLSPAPQRAPQNAGGDDFGLRDSRLKSVTARMASYSFNRKGDFTVTLANGQTWRQLSGDTSFAHWTGDAGRYTVRVSRGVLGSYNLEVRDHPGMYKVHRLE